MTSRRWLLCLFLSALALHPHTAKADITPIDYSPPPTGGGVSPKAPHPSIRLDDQEVIIRLKESTYAVEAVFHLFNTGETSTEWIGFPKNAMGRPAGPLGQVQDFIRFSVSVNNRNVSVSDEGGLLASVKRIVAFSPSRKEGKLGWLVGRATFPGHAATTILVSYESYYEACGFNCAQAKYLYGTGGYWKDPIGRATFIVDSLRRRGDEKAEALFAAHEVSKYLIRRRLLAAYVSQYEIRNFEPNPDSALTFMFTRSRMGEKGDLEGLTTAVMNGRVDQVRALLNKGVDVNARIMGDETPLMYAARGGHLKMAKLLVDHGADVNLQTKQGRTALKAALSRAWLEGGHAEVARFLKEKGARSTTLAVAAFAGDMESVRRFLAEGTAIDEKSRYDEPSPLFAAAMGGQPDVAEVLIDTGFAVDARDERGKTPLMTAAENGKAEVAKVLLDRGADVNAKDARRESALHHAVMLRGHMEVVKVLLEGGANVNARDTAFDRTILMHAVGSGNVDVVRMLLEKGADVNARDAGGETALTLMRGKDIDEIERLLRAYGAKK